MHRFLVLISLVAGCAYEGEHGENCIVPFNPCGGGGGGGGGWLEVTRLGLSDDSEYSNPDPGRGSTVRLVSHYQDSIAITTTSPGASIAPSGDGDYVLTTGTADRVDLVIDVTLPDGSQYQDTEAVWTAAVSRVAVAPFPTEPYAPGGYRLAAEPAVYTIGALTTIQLLDEQDDRLFDPSVTLGDGTSDGITQPAWDQLQLPGQPGTYQARIVADSFGERSVDFTVVAGIDRITAEWQPIVKSYYGGRELCFHAYAGDREVYTSWNITAEETLYPRANCAWVGDAGTITGTTLGLTHDFVAVAEEIPAGTEWE